MGRSIVERLKGASPARKSSPLEPMPRQPPRWCRGGGVRVQQEKNAVVFNCSQADVVIGPVGIYFANSMLEVTPPDRRALAACRAEKFRHSGVLPYPHHGNRRAIPFPPISKRRFPKSSGCKTAEIGHSRKEPPPIEIRCIYHRQENAAAWQNKRNCF